MNPPTVIVSAGSYHLPFNRLIEWMEPWVVRNPGVHVLMQHGPSRPLPGAVNRDVLPYHELMSICERATAIVLQGGAGGVMDMRGMQRIPIVVPRIPVDDEVVDDHQLLFSEKVAESGVIYRATDRERLWELLDSAVDGSLQTFASAPEPTDGVAGVRRALRELPAPVRRVRQVRRLVSSIVGFRSGR